MKPRSQMLKDADIADQERLAAYHTVVDTDGVEIGRLPAKTATADVVDDRPLERIYTETFPHRITRWFVDGEAVIICLGAATAGVFVACVTELVLSAITAFHMIVAALPTILGLLVVATLIPILLRKKGGSNTVVVKGCAKSGFPGPVTIRR